MRSTAPLPRQASGRIGGNRSQPRTLKGLGRAADQDPNQNFRPPHRVGCLAERADNVSEPFRHPFPMEAPKGTPLLPYRYL
jgi:hypothetical protein